MDLHQQIETLKTGEYALSQAEYDAVYAVFTQRINTQGIEGSLLLPHSLRQLSNINDVTNTLNSLVEHGFLRSEWIFWDEGGDDFHEFHELDEEEEAELVAELNKSKAADEKYERLSHEYIINCGRIVHPEKGSNGFDPLEHLGKHYYFTDKLKVDPSLVEYTEHDKDVAMRQLFPAELLPELEVLSQKIAMKRLGL